MYFCFTRQKSAISGHDSPHKQFTKRLAAPVATITQIEFRLFPLRARLFNSHSSQNGRRSEELLTPLTRLSKKLSEIAFSCCWFISDGWRSLAFCGALCIWHLCIHFFLFLFRRRFANCHLCLTFWAAAFSLSLSFAFFCCLFSGSKSSEWAGPRWRGSRSQWHTNKNRFFMDSFSWRSTREQHLHNYARITLSLIRSSLLDKIFFFN